MMGREGNMADFGCKDIEWRLQILKRGLSPFLFFPFPLFFFSLARALSLVAPAFVFATESEGAVEPASIMYENVTLFYDSSHFSPELFDQTTLSPSAFVPPKMSH